MQSFVTFKLLLQLVTILSFTGIVSSIVALAGPIGMVASSILSVMSSFFGLFGGSESESQESMIKRVVEAAISDYRDKDMKEDIEGVKQIYQSLSSSVQNFRERKADMSASQAEELYNQIFMGLPVFGKFSRSIQRLRIQCPS